MSVEGILCLDLQNPVSVESILGVVFCTKILGVVLIGEEIEAPNYGAWSSLEVTAFA